MSSSAPSKEQLIELVSRNPGLTKWELVGLLRRSGWSITTSELNSRIYRIPQLEWRPGIGYERRWFPVGPAEPSASPRQGDDSEPDLFDEFGDVEPKQEPESELGLYPWQEEALAVWEASGRVGVVEAVTGAGKTRLAIAAIDRQLALGGRTVIVVPTLELVRQWREELEELLVSALRRDVSIGELGGGSYGSVASHHVLIATASSACKYELLPHGHRGLLVADEVHHYGAPAWSALLEEGFQARLGLTATYEQDHDGYEKFLDPYFRDVVYRVDFRRALEDDVIAPFRIAFVGVRFEPDEKRQYDEHDEKVRQKFGVLVNQFGLPSKPFGDFMREVNRLKKRGDSQASFQAGLYLSAFTKRRHVLASARSKYDRLRSLADSVRDADKTIIFAQTVDAASKAIECLSEEGLDGAVLSSSMSAPERKDVLAAFEDADGALVAAPKLLDEGVDVAAADLAIILASSRSRRQMIQRMGRVLRLKEDGREARIVVLYVEGTSEDPRVSQESFLDLVEGVATEIRYFSADASANQLRVFLHPAVS